MGLFSLCYGVCFVICLEIVGVFFLWGTQVVNMRMVLLKPVSSTWNFTQTLSFLLKKEEEYTFRVKSCFSVSFIISFEH